MGAALIVATLDVGLKAAIAAVVATAIARLLRAETARVRYRVWLGALAITMLAIIVASLSLGTDAHAAPLEMPRHFVPWSLSTMLVWLWTFGVAAHIAKIAAGFLGLALDARRLTPAREHGWRRHVDKARTALGLHSSVRVLYGHPDAVPVCWGVFRGTIVVPAAAIAWSGRMCRAVVLHECAHLRRRDPLVMLAEQIVCAILWFNPAIWFIVGQLRRERELACDEAVVAAGVRSDVYARLLIALARRCRPAHVSAHAIVRPCEMQDRVAALLVDEPTTVRRRYRRVALASGAALLVLTLTRVVTIAPADHFSSPQPGESPASFRAGFAERAR
jgi:beta-lactamase regulating signal transducer with metallopeptidase domain